MFLSQKIKRVIFFSFSIYGQRELQIEKKKIQKFLKYYRRRNSEIKFSNRVAIRTLFVFLNATYFYHKTTKGSYSFFLFNLSAERTKNRNSEIKFRLLFTFANFNCTLSIFPTACFIYYLRN